MARKTIGTLMSEKKKNKLGKQYDYSEIYRQLRTNIEFSSFEKKMQVINVTSTNPGEGKSSVSVNTALVFSAKYKNVLIIDCDLRKPVIHSFFKISNKIGLSNLLKDMDNETDVSKYFQRFKDSNSGGKIHVLTSGSKVPNPQELLASDKFKKLIHSLRDTFDVIIIDCPPLSAVSDAIYVANHCDGTIFVVSSQDTNKDAAKTALTQLERSGVHVLGTVLTKVESSNSFYYNNYYSSEE